MMIKQNWKELLWVQLGSGILSLPILMVGSSIFQMSGKGYAIFVILLGNALLWGLGFLGSQMAIKNQKVVVDNAKTSFGKLGVILFSLIYVFSMLGWFSIQIDTLVQGLFPHISSPFWVTSSCKLICGLLACLVTQGGVHTLEKVNRYCVPVLAVLLLLTTFSGPVAIAPSSHFSLEALSLVMAVGLGAAVDTPTFFKHAKSSKDGMIAMTLLFGALLPLVEIMGAFCSGQGMLHQALPLFLFLAAWGASSGNLYSAHANSTLFFLKESPKNLWILAFIGVLLSFLSPSLYLIPFLNIAGVLIGSFAGAILGSYLIGKKEAHYVGFSPLVLGIIGGGCDALWHLFTPPIIAIAISFITAALITHFKKETTYATIK